ILETTSLIFRKIAFWAMIIFFIFSFAEKTFAQNAKTKEEVKITCYVFDFKKQKINAKIALFGIERDAFNGMAIFYLEKLRIPVEEDVVARYGKDQVKKNIEYDSKKQILNIYLHKEKYKFRGKAKYTSGKFAAHTKIIFSGEEVMTDSKGDFEFYLPSHVQIENSSKFKINGQEYVIRDLRDLNTYGLLLADEPKLEQPKNKAVEYTIQVFDEHGKAIPKKEINLGGQNIMTDEKGMFKYTHENNESPFESMKISLKGYALTTQNFTNPEKSSINFRKSSTETAEVVVEVSEANTDTSGYAYSNDFNLIINELELEKQNLSQKGVLILSQIEAINIKLNNHEGEITSNEKKRLKADLERLVGALVANEVAYEDAQEKTKNVVDKMTNLVSEKDTQIQEVKEEVESTKNFALAELVIFSLTSLILIAIAIVYYFVARNIKKQKEEIEKAYKNIEGINEIGQKIAATLDFDGLAMTVHQNVAALMDANVFGVGAYNAKDHRLEFRRFIDSGEMIPYLEESLANESKFSVWCFKNQKPVIINDLSIDYKKYLKVDKYDVSSEMPQSLIYLPLISENQPKGVVTVQSFRKNAYSEQSLMVLQTLASYIAIALENTQSYKIIQDRNKNITDSIRYAKTIQQAILPSENAMKECLSDYFTIFIPKDIVSGDFYWFSQIAENKYFLAVVDCTGHGVPGAFMSMIGNAFLNEIVNTNDIHNPAQVLENLNISVRNVLKQDEKTNDDGMDACLCMVEKVNQKENKVLFSGAKRPLYFVRSLTNELQTLKGDSKSVGGFSLSAQPFTCQELMLNTNDMLYLTSDGMIDQSGNEKQKFGTPRLQQILKENSHLSATTQREKLLQALKDHQKEAEQRDDITLLGIKM
ncbi:MAG: hypothetical protein EAZ97_12945, partial [Bacteroidetes bacterium]